MPSRSYIVRPKQLEAEFGIPRPTGYLWSRDPDHPFPSIRKFGPQASGWLRSELEAWAESGEQVYPKNAPEPDQAA